MDACSSRLVPTTHLVLYTPVVFNIIRLLAKLYRLLLSGMKLVFKHQDSLIMFGLKLNKYE